MTGSNRRPSACKADALPAELILHVKISEATSYSCRGKPPTTIGAKELNFRVRYGNGCDLFAIITRLYKIERVILSKLDKRFIDVTKRIWLSPRSISIRQLHVSPHFHLEPIYLIVFEGSYLLA